MFFKSLTRRHGGKDLKSQRITRIFRIIYLERPACEKSEKEKKQKAKASFKIVEKFMQGLFPF